MVGAGDQLHILPQQRNEEQDSTGEGLDQRVKPLVQLKKYPQGLNSQNRPGAFPSLLVQGKQKTPYKGHQPEYLL